MLFADSSMFMWMSVSVYARPDQDLKIGKLAFNFRDVCNIILFIIRYRFVAFCSPLCLLDCTVLLCLRALVVPFTFTSNHLKQYARQSIKDKSLNRIQNVNRARVSRKLNFRGNVPRNHFCRDPLFRPSLVRAFQLRHPSTWRLLFGLIQTPLQPKHSRSFSSPVAFLPGVLYHGSFCW